MGYNRAVFNMCMQDEICAEHDDIYAIARRRKAENPLPVLKITGFETCGPHRMRVVFNDGATRLFDGHVLLKGEAFAPLADAKTFADCKLDYETMTWLDGALDIAPEFVYENSTACQ